MWSARYLAAAFVHAAQGGAPEQMLEDAISERIKAIKEEPRGFQ
jgi:hypothetical protein